MIFHLCTFLEKAKTLTYNFNNNWFPGLSVDSIVNGWKTALI